MTTYYVDDGGDGTTENSWATADVSINDLKTEYTFVSNDIVYFGHDHVCQAVNAASLIVSGPASGLPVYFISATQGSSPAAYQASTTAQIDTSEGAYNLTFDGSFAHYGMSYKSGGNIVVDPDDNEFSRSVNSRFALGANAYLNSAGNLGRAHYENGVLDLTADGTTTRSQYAVLLNGSTEINGLTFVNAGYRTGYIFELYGYYHNVDGADLSGFTQAACEIAAFSARNSVSSFNNCITVANPTFMDTSYPTPLGRVTFTNCGPANSPTQLFHRNYFGELISTAAITRTGGGTIEGTACSWLITTRSVAGEASPFATPWAYGKVASTGSKTFDVYITNDTADFTDAEVWLEIESLNTTSEALFTLSSDTRATITTTVAAQTDDVTSTWSGTGPSYTYKQKLSVTATVNVSGVFRWRVCCGVASVASSRYFYVDSLCTVS